MNKQLEEALSTLDSKTKEMVDSPDHYQSSSMQVINVIESFKLGFNLGNVIKYILRAGKKDPSKFNEDLRKGLWYLTREINNKSDKKIKVIDLDRYNELLLTEKEYNRR